MNTVIEFNGRQHYDRVMFNRGYSDLNTNIQYDLIKSEYCKTNTRLIIIRYDEDIKIRLIESKIIY
jgi:hypothetical protein